MALGLRPSNIQKTLTMLSRAVDDIWYLSGDRSFDMKYYSRRAMLLGIYSATGLFEERASVFD